MTLSIAHRAALSPPDTLLGLVDALVRRRVHGWAEVSYLSEERALVLVCVPLGELRVVEVQESTDLAVPVTAQREPWELWELLTALRPADEDANVLPAWNYKTYLNARGHAA